MTTMHWERAEEAQIDPKSYYVVRTNGGDWRDLDLFIFKGLMVRHKLKPEMVRDRPIWVAKITEPTS